MPTDPVAFLLLMNLKKVFARAVNKANCLSDLFFPITFSLKQFLILLVCI